MNPSDEEEDNNDVPMTSREVDELLEPKEIPRERIVRHAETNDSYREAPSLGNDEEIIQPPLEESVEENEVEESSSTGVEQETQQTQPKDLEPQEEAESTQMEAEEIPQVEDTVPITQDAILESSSISQVVTEPVEEKEILSPVQTSQTASATPPVVVIQTESHPAQPVATGEPVVYHTVSGGPETIHDKMAEQLHKAQLGSVGTNSPTIAVHSNESSASGYTIPNPNYVSPIQHQPEYEVDNNIGITTFLIVMAIVGGAGTYLYFFMPQTFDQIYDAVMIVFTEILKNFE